jgi:predicted lipoprotein with Yx(FWY)xxD motif
MKFRRGFLALIAVPVLAIGLAACGGSSNSSDNSSSNAASSAPAQTAASSSDTVGTKSVSGVGTVLVDSKGNVLYTNNQDTASKMACTASCQSIWPALMASSGKPTSSDSAVQAKLGVANGQVTFDGKPLYTFVQDSPGQATGNGFMDSFDGTSFTWTAAMASGTASTSGSTSSAPAATTSSSSSSSGGSSGGGYGY